jgi:hypothetical protein
MSILLGSANRHRRLPRLQAIKLSVGCTSMDENTNARERGTLCGHPRCMKVRGRLARGQGLVPEKRSRL